MIRGVLALGLLLLGPGCDGESKASKGKGDVKTVSPRAPDAKAPASEVEAADTKRAEAKAPEVDAERKGAYRRAGDPAAGIDEFVFWGWSEDGRYYAFETFHHGSDMVNCEGEAELTIVDAETDRYAEDGHVQLVYEEAEAEVCDPPDLEAELAHRREPRLVRYGISAGYIGGPLPLTKGEGSGRWSFTPSDGGPIEVSFRVLHETDDPYAAADGAAFVLKVKQEGMSEVTIEPGRRRRPWTLRYGLDEGMVFVGPKGRHTAIMVAQKMTMPEGVRTTWMSSGVELR